MARKYESSIREERREATRKEIVDAAARLVAAPAADVQVGDVARAAGVAVATVYRYFSSKDAILDAVYDRWMEQPRQVLADKPDDREARLDRLAELWAAQAIDEDLERAMSIYNPAGRSVRRRRLARRRAAAAEVVSDVQTADPETKRFLEAVVLLLTSTTAHRHLREHWEMSTEEAARAAAWAVRALVDAASARAG